MGAVPVIPSFPAGTIVTGAALEQLCQAITWCTSGRPLARLQQNTAQTVGTGSFTAITWDTRIADRDGGWLAGSSTRYTAQTPGFYVVAANVAWASNTTGLRGHYFQVTTGSNNPAGAGVTTQFGFTTLQADGAAGRGGSCSKAISPYMYTGDYAEVYGYQNSGGNLATSGAGANAMFYTIMHVSG